MNDEESESNQPFISLSTWDRAQPLASWCLHLFNASMTNLTHWKAKLDLSSRFDAQINCGLLHTIESKSEALSIWWFESFNKSFLQSKHSAKIPINKGDISEPNAAHACILKLRDRESRTKSSENFVVIRQLERTISAFDLNFKTKGNTDEHFNAKARCLSSSQMNFDKIVK